MVDLKRSCSKSFVKVVCEGCPHTSSCSIGMGTFNQSLERVPFPFDFNEHQIMYCNMVGNANVIAKTGTFFYNRKNQQRNV